MSRFKDYLEYYKKKLERNINDEDMVDHVFEKLTKTEFPVYDLLGTGIYKTVRAICKSEGEFAKKALPLYNKWKLIILAEQNGQNKALPAPLKAPPPYRENETQDILKSLPHQPIDLKNGLTDVLRNQPSVSEVNSVHSFPKDGGTKPKNFNPTPDSYPLRNFDAVDEAAPRAKSSSQSSVNAFQPYNSYTSNDGGFRSKGSSASQMPVNKFQPFSNYNNVNDAAYASKNSLPPQPSVNSFQPFSNFSNSSEPVHIKTENSAVHTKTENSAGQSVTEFSNFDSHSNFSNPCSTPNSTSSQNPLDIEAVGTTSPSKVGRIPDPYTIEMREGMFRVVKSSEGLTPDIIRVRRLYTQEEDLSETELNSDGPMKSKPKSNEMPEKYDKTDGGSKDHTDRSEDKRHSSNSKHQSLPVRENRVEKHVSSSSKGAIDKTKVKGDKLEFPKSDKHVSPHKSSSKSSRHSSPKLSHSKGSPVAKSGTKASPSAKSSSRESLKSNIKGSPSKSSSRESPVKSSSKDNLFSKSSSRESPLKSGSKESSSSKSSSRESPMKSSTRGSSPFVKSSAKEHTQKSSSKGSPSTKSNGKRSPHNQIPASAYDAKKTKLIPKDCDKKLSKVSSSNSAESFISSKKERTSVYSGKRTSQEVPSLLACCVRVLQKNLEYIRHTRGVPYEVLKPILMYCHYSQLRKLEETNPYLLQHTDEIWKLHCQKLSRDARPHSSGTWRELFRKVKEDQNKKLKDITASISATRQKSAPERLTMLTESPERPRKRMKSAPVPEFKEAAVRVLPKEPVHNSMYKESNSSNASVQKLPTKEAILAKPSKESIPPAQKKVKKAPVAPLMSKVKKTMGGIFAMHKK